MARAGPADDDPAVYANTHADFLLEFLHPRPLGEDRGEGGRIGIALTLPSPKGRG